MMTLLRLIGRLAQDGVSDAVPERVALHRTCRGTPSGSPEVKVKSADRGQRESGTAESPCVKFRSPPPSVVPAAKL